MDSIFHVKNCLFYHNFRQKYPNLEADDDQLVEYFKEIIKMREDQTQTEQIVDETQQSWTCCGLGDPVKVVPGKPVLGERLPRSQNLEKEEDCCPAPIENSPIYILIKFSMIAAEYSNTNTNTNTLSSGG